MKEIPLAVDRHITNLKQALKESCELYANNTYSHTKENGEWVERSYRELYEDVVALYTAFADLGIDGKHVGLITDTRGYEWDVAYAATIWGPGVIVPLSGEWTETQIENCAKKAEIEALIHSDKLSKRIDPLKSKLENVNHFIKMGTDTGELTIASLIEKGKALIKNGDRRYENAEIDENALAAIYFTSGTNTGNPKGVMLCQKGYASAVEGLTQMVKMDETKRLLSFLTKKAHHIYEGVVGLWVTIYKGASIIHSNGNFPKDMQEKHPTELVSVPAGLEHFAKQISTGLDKKDKKTQTVAKIMAKATNVLGKRGLDMKKKVFKEILDNFGGDLETIFLGGSKVNTDDIRILKDYCGVECIQAYGGTETNTVTSVNQRGSSMIATGSIRKTFARSRNENT